jgi:hypothetical protein
MTLTIHPLSQVLSIVEVKCKALECDGLSKVISGILTLAGVKHLIEVGTLLTPRGEIPHHWIRIDDDFIIDYRARMWLGNGDEVPHGIFQSENYQMEGYISPEDAFDFGKILAIFEGVKIEEFASQLKKEIH